MTFYPSYLDLRKRGVLADRVARALGKLNHCRLCPRSCGVDRTGGGTGICRTGRFAEVSSYGPHSGEEDCLRGRRGSGTIFFTHCNLRCTFCQNNDISQTGSRGTVVTAEALAGIMLELQDLGCHNLNFVTPSHVVPQILEALLVAVPKGFTLPLVYNSGGYDSPETLRLLDGLVDVYMPDLKIWDREYAGRYLRAEDYRNVACAAVTEMHRQVGDLEIGADGLARRGLLVRHLVMPNGVAGTTEIMTFLAHQLSPGTYVNLMSQYWPTKGVCRDPLIGRRITAAEYDSALTETRAAGISRLDDVRRPFR